MDHHTTPPAPGCRKRIGTGLAKAADYNSARIASDTAELVRFVREANWKALTRACFWLARLAEVQIEAERALAAIDGKEAGHGRRG